MGVTPIRCGKVAAQFACACSASGEWRSRKGGAPKPPYPVHVPPGGAWRGVIMEEGQALCEAWEASMELDPEGEPEGDDTEGGEDGAMAETVSGEEEHTDTEQADMGTGVMSEGEMHVTSGGATSSQRTNAPAGRWIVRQRVTYRPHLSINRRAADILQNQCINSG